MRGSRPRQYLDISDLDFDLSLDLDLRGRIFKIAITRSISNGRGYCTSVLVILYIGGVMTCWQQLRSKSDFRDVTLVCDDGKIKVHKFIIIFTNCSH